MIAGWLDWMSRPIHAVSEVLTGPTEEPLTLEEAKLRAGMTWVAGDERDALMTGFIKAARAKVELDTGLALLTQTRAVYLDALCPGPIALPGGCTPVQTILSVEVTLNDGTTELLAADEYIVDDGSHPARLLFTSSVSTPSNALALQPWTIRLIAGWETPAAIPPLLVHAVGLLASHYMTLGRDVVTIGAAVDEIPWAYEAAIHSYRPVGVA